MKDQQKVLYIMKNIDTKENAQTLDPKISFCEIYQ